MTNYTRTEQWRIKRSAAHLDKALDSLTRAKGELRPIRELDERVGRLVTEAEQVYREMVNGSAQPKRMVEVSRDDDPDGDGAEERD